MKRIILTVTAIILVLALCACNGGEQSGISPSESNDDGIELPQWNGFDFGRNLEYSEEYIQEGDPGEYISTYEAAAYIFNRLKENGNIPEYSDSTEYTMVLVGIEKIGEADEECYIYRLDVAEPTGTVGAAYAYAYKSGNIYMQGYESQWVIVYTGRGVLFTMNEIWA